MTMRFQKLKSLLLKMTGIKSSAKRTKPSFKKKYKRHSSKNLYDAVDFLRKVRVDEMNRSVERQIIDRVKNAGGAVKIGFVVNERAKWSCQSLWEEFRKDDLFEVQLCLYPLNRADYSDCDRKNFYMKEREFFLNVDENLVDFYDWESDIVRPIEETDVDILFFQQPWGMIDFPRRMVGKALSAYIHYGLPLLDLKVAQYSIGSFHPYIWKCFVQTEKHKLLQLKHDPSSFDKLVVTGYPKLDVYLNDFLEIDGGMWAEGPLKRIIFAPHYSVAEDSIRISTFAWSGEKILRLAQTLQGLQWVYKPHPKLGYSIVDAKIMDEMEYRKYKQSWGSLKNGSIYDSGDYFNLFRSSDGLITDCGSFLAEYLPTGKPIIWLVSEDHIGFNAVGDGLIDCYYQARNFKELRDLIKNVILEGSDPLKERRAEAVRSLFPKSNRSSTEIVQHIKAHLTID